VNRGEVRTGDGGSCDHEGSRDRDGVASRNHDGLVRERLLAKAGNVRVQNPRSAVAEPEGHRNSDHARDLPIDESVLERTKDGRRA